MMRINRFMAQSGVAARRKCDDLISAGKVKVNGEVIDQLGLMIDEDKDHVEVNGRSLNIVSEFTYIVLNKPVETIASVEDQHQRRTVVELIETSQRIFPVGRLDYNTTGVILLTDDGELTNQLIHPKFKAPKVYQVLIDKKIKPIDIHRIIALFQIIGQAKFDATVFDRAGVVLKLQGDANDIARSDFRAFQLGTDDGRHPVARLDVHRHVDRLDVQRFIRVL